MKTFHLKTKAALTRDGAPLCGVCCRLIAPAWLLSSLNDSVLEKQARSSSRALDPLLMEPPAHDITSRVLWCAITTDFSLGR